MVRVVRGSVRPTPIGQEAWLVPSGTLALISSGPRHKAESRSPPAGSEFAGLRVPGWTAAWWSGLGGWAALVEVGSDPWQATPKTRQKGEGALRSDGAAE